MVNYMIVQQILFLPASMRSISHPRPTNLKLGPVIVFAQWNVNRCDPAEASNAVV